MSTEPSKRKKLSGAQFRSQKREKEKQKEKLAGSMFKFLNTSVNKQFDENTATDTPSTSGLCPKSTSINESEEEKMCDSPAPSENTTSEDTLEEIPEEFLSNISSSVIPINDNPGLWPDIINVDIVNILVRRGPVQVQKWQYWLLLIMSSFQFSTPYRLVYLDSMKCGYGERGSLTATCTNVNIPSFFKSTSYRFDHLDETLQCLNCSLKSIEANTFDISGNQIKHLILKNSNIDQLQRRAFVGLVFLEDMDLSDNKIVTIPSGTFAGVKKIISVNLKNNSVTLLANDGFTELFNLETLILSQNEISIINLNAFSGLKSLKMLNLNGNHISNVTAVFNNLTSLQYLDLSENNINNLRGNEFGNLTSLLELKLDKNKIKKLPSLEFLCMENLEFLGLSNNYIEQFETQAFEGLKELESLDLGNNNIAKIPEKTFQNLHGLVDMNLTGNFLEIFQISRFAGLPRLRSLNLSNNRIEEIDSSGIIPLHDLHSLDISSNNLTDLNYVVLLHRMPKISYMSLQNNRWPCYLEDEMLKFFNEENFKFVLFENKNGSVECNDNIVSQKKDYKIEPLEQAEQRAVVAQSISSSSEIFLFSLIIVLSVAVLLLAYTQYRISRELRFNPLLLRRRTTSEVKLFHSDLQDNDSDQMR